MGVFLLLCDPHSFGHEYLCNVTYPLKTMKNYFCKAIQVRGCEVTPSKPAVAIHQRWEGQVLIQVRYYQSWVTELGGAATPWLNGSVRACAQTLPVVWLRGPGGGFKEGEEDLFLLPWSH